MTKYITIAVSKELFDAIERARGNVPRSEYIRNFIENRQEIVEAMTCH